jgi:hypothetical protein
MKQFFRRHAPKLPAAPPKTAKNHVLKPTFHGEKDFLERSEHLVGNPKAAKGKLAFLSRREATDMLRAILSEMPCDGFFLIVTGERKENLARQFRSGTVLQWSALAHAANVPDSHY